MCASSCCHDNIHDVSFLLLVLYVHDTYRIGALGFFVEARMLKLWTTGV